MKLNIIVLKHLSAAQKAVQAAHVAVQFGEYFQGYDEYQEWAVTPTIILREASFVELNRIVHEFNRNTGMQFTFFEEDEDMGIGPLTAVALLIPEPWPKGLTAGLLDISRLHLV